VRHPAKNSRPKLRQHNPRRSRRSASAVSACSSPRRSTAHLTEQQLRISTALAWTPEWPATTVVTLSWVALLAGHDRHPAPVSSNPQAGLAAVHAIVALANWPLMAIAMMGPMALPAVRHVGLNSISCRRRRAMMLYFAVYMGVWIAFCFALLIADRLIGIVNADGRIGLPMALAAAAVWQATPIKRRALVGCRRTVPLPPMGRQADRACIEFALMQGARALTSCWPFMVIAAAVGSNLLWMEALAALVALEELTERGRMLLHPGAAALALAAGVFAVAF
jgi:predicted metal-binding membrane protein